jgi:hypothetical protein
MDENLAAGRKGIFHWATRQYGCAGHTDTLPAQSFCFGHRADDVYNVITNNASFNCAHELGHNFGIDHEMLSPHAKPNWASIMSYAYGDVMNSWFHFSNGRSADLHGSSLVEWTPYSPYVDVSYLLGHPFFFKRASTCSNCIDWNRDGEFSESVRAHLGPRFTFNVDDVGAQPTVVGDEKLPQLGASVVGVAADELAYDACWPSPPCNAPYTYVFAHKSTDDHIWYNSKPTTSGAWPPWTSIATPVHSNCQPATAVFTTTADGEQMYVFTANSGQQIQYIPFGYHGPSYWNNDYWRVLADNPANVSFQEVSASIYTTTGGGQFLFLVARDTASDNVYWRYLSSSGYWASWTLARDTTNGSMPIPAGGYTPGIAGGPDGKLYMITKDNDAASPRLHLPKLYAFNGWGWIHPANWDSNSNSVWMGQNPMAGPATVVFRRHLDSLGAPLANGKGALWVMYLSANSTAAPDYFWTWGPFGPTTDTTTAIMPATGTLAIGPWHEGIGYAAVGDGSNGCVPTLGAGKRVAIVHRTDRMGVFWPDDGDPQSPVPTGCPQGPGVYHKPYADGQTSVVMSDFNDHEKISQTLCPSLGAVWCGTEMRAMAPRPVTGPCP